MKAVLTDQAVGAYGEKIVEAELLRNGWMPANVNKTVTNAKAFDVLAYKDDEVVRLRVRTCRQKTIGFVFPSFDANRNIGDDDFTILVRMGAERNDDQIFVLPTRVLQKQIETYAAPKLQSGSRKNVRWTLRFREHSKGERSNYGFERKWSEYRDNWALLETARSKISSRALGAK